MPFVFLVILCSKSFGLEFGLEHRCLIQIGFGVFGACRAEAQRRRVFRAKFFPGVSSLGNSFATTFQRRASARFPDSGLSFGGGMGLPSAEGNQSESQFQAE